MAFSATKRLFYFSPKQKPKDAFQVNAKENKNNKEMNSMKLFLCKTVW